MKTYYIYNMGTDKYLGSIKAVSIVNAEIKFSAEHDLTSDSVYALSTAPREPLA